MGNFIAALWGGLLAIAPTLIGRIIIALGLGLVSYAGIDTSLGWLKGQIAASFGGMGAQTMGVLSGAGLGSAVAIVLSAIGARLALDALVAGKKLVIK